MVLLEMASTKFSPNFHLKTTLFPPGRLDIRSVIPYNMGERW